MRRSKNKGLSMEDLERKDCKRQHAKDAGFSDPDICDVFESNVTCCSSRRCWGKIMELITRAWHK